MIKSDNKKKNSTHTNINFETRLTTIGLTTIILPHTVNAIKICGFSTEFVLDFCQKQIRDLAQAHGNGGS